MEIKIEVTEEQIQEALDRQVRVALGHFFQSKEVNAYVIKKAKEIGYKLIDEATATFTLEGVKEMYLQRLQTEVDKKVKTKLKGL